MSPCKRRAGGTRYSPTKSRKPRNAAFFPRSFGFQVEDDGDRLYKPGERPFATTVLKIESSLLVPRTTINLPFFKENFKLNDQNEISFRRAREIPPPTFSSPHSFYCFRERSIIPRFSGRTTPLSDFRNKRFSSCKVTAKHQVSLSLLKLTESNRNLDDLRRARGGKSGEARKNAKGEEKRSENSIDKVSQPVFHHSYIADHRVP